MTRRRPHSKHSDRKTEAPTSQGSTEVSSSDESFASMDLFVQAELRRISPQCDQPAQPDDPPDVKLGRGLKYPVTDRGYAKFLIKRGIHPNLAGMMAARLVAEGERRAETSRCDVEFVKLLEKLARDGLDDEAFCRCATRTVELMDRTSLMDGLFDDLPLLDKLPPFFELEFIRALRWCEQGDLTGRALIVVFARQIKDRARTKRGPKLKAISAAHQYFLESIGVISPVAYTVSPDDYDFTDEMTAATREEFSDPDFSPKSAQRRIKSKAKPADS